MQATAITKDTLMNRARVIEIDDEHIGLEGEVQNATTYSCIVNLFHGIHVTRRTCTRQSDGTLKFLIVTEAGRTEHRVMNAISRLLFL